VRFAFSLVQILLTRNDVPLVTTFGSRQDARKSETEACMTPHNGPKPYHPVTKVLHWLVFLAVAAQYAVGEFMPHIGRNAQYQGLDALHIMLGGAVLALIVVAITWRLTHPVPQLPELPGWQRAAAFLTHWSMYIIILAMTLLGWAATDYRGWPVTIAGVVPLPAIAHKGDGWAHTAGDIHTFLVNVLLALVALHVIAALYHQFVVRDGVMKRILPGS
jgi:cytochrome b561